MFLAEKPNGAANLDSFKPAGFYYKEVWRPTSDVLLRQFDDTAAITRCLEGKVLRMYGDSTVRQWFEYLTAALPGETAPVFRSCVIRYARPQQTNSWPNSVPFMVNPRNVSLK